MSYMRRLWCLWLLGSCTISCPTGLSGLWVACACSGPALWCEWVQKVPVKLCDRRPGDASEVYSATEKAEKELDWR